MNEALRSFNHSRKDPLFVDDSICHMVDIYLQADADMPKPSAERRTSMLGSGGSKKNDVDEAHAPNAAAEFLLQSHVSTSERFRVLKARTLIASNDKENIEKANGILLEILNENKEYAPALLVSWIRACSFFASKYSYV
jgi:hypothetical protein